MVKPTGPDWDAKDFRIVRQNLLNRAYDAWCSGKIEAKTPKDLENYAEGHLNYIYNGLEQEKVVLNSPKPTAQQAKILLKVAEDLGTDLQNVIDFCWKKWEKYPTEEKSIAIVIEEFQKG